MTNISNNNTPLKEKAERSTMQSCDQKEAIQKMSEEISEIKERLHTGDMLLGHLKAMGQKQDEMYKRMFVDNGKKSIQTILASTGVHLKLQWFFIGGGLMTLIGLALKVWLQP